jgi:hypothetical protein
MADAQPNPETKEAPSTRTVEEIEASLAAHLETTLENASEDTDLACRRLEYLMRTPRGALLVLNRLRRGTDTNTADEAVDYGMRIGVLKGRYENDEEVMGGGEYIEELIDLAAEILTKAVGRTQR